MKIYFKAVYLCVFGFLNFSTYCYAAGTSEFEDWLEANQTTDFQFIPGTKITSENCQEFLPFVPPAYQKQGFCFEGMEYTLTDPGDLSPPNVFKEATEKFAGQAGLDPDGALINYTAGKPFDETKFVSGSREDGFKAMWNFNYRWQHDGLKIEDVEWVWVEKSDDNHDKHPIMKTWQGQFYQGGGKFARILNGPYQRVYMNHLAHRAETDYRIPGRWAEKTEFREYTGFDAPFDIAGTSFLILRYKDPHKADDSWAYIPSLRRVRRISVEVKSDSLLGTEDTLEDFYGFSGRLLEWDWEYLGKAKILAIARSRNLNTVFGGPHGWQEIDDYSLVEVNVIKGKPKRSNHPYSTKIMMTSTVNDIPYYSEAYDSAGELWKIWKIPAVWTEDPQFKERDKFGGDLTPEGTKMSAFQGIQVVNLQNGRATLIPCRGLSYPRTELSKIKRDLDINILSEGR